MPNPTDTSRVHEQVSNLLIQKQWILCALYDLDETDQTPATADTILKRHADYAQTTPAAPVPNDLLHEYLDALVAANLIKRDDADPPRYNLAIDSDAIRTGLEQSPRFQLTEALRTNNIL